MIERPDQHPADSESSDAQRHPGFAPPLRETETTAAAYDGWSPGELEIAPRAAPPVPRDRILSPRVLIVWAALTLVAYFGIRLVGTVVRDSVQQAIASSARSARNSGSNIVIMLPNGKKITIHRDVPSPPRPPVLPGAAAGADPDPDIDIGAEPTVAPQPVRTPSTKGLPDAKAPPAAKAPPPAEPKTSPSRR